ncbi:MAG: ribosome recycling factor [Chloroflexi bacterium]|nr:ribosome recycling factor [Chloroflexota bacterium]
MVDEVLAEAEGKMHKAIESLRRELAAIRTGRASPGLVERIQVEYYGVPTPLIQLASITTPASEPHVLVIQPWDKNAFSAIEKAILKSDLGLNPVNDGRVIRLIFPKPSEERRRELVRLARKKVEEGRVAIRNCRRDALEDLKDLEKEKLISEDDLRRDQERLQKSTDRSIEESDHIGAKKEEEILEV